MLALFAVVGSVAAEVLVSTKEVRIVARRLDDGRTEFALQERDGTGWSDRILPTRRFFPAELGHDRWLVSSPISVTVETDVPSAPTPTATPEPTLPQSAYGDTNAEVANFWIYLWNKDFGSAGTILTATALAFVDLDQFDLDVRARRNLATEEYCNASAIFSGELAELGCAGPDWRHEEVENVAVTVDVGLLDYVHYRCTRQDSSTEDESVWACWLR